MASAQRLQSTKASQRYSTQPEMTGEESTKQPTSNPPDEQPKPTKEILLSSLANIANEVKRLGNATLSEELDELQRLMKRVSENNEKKLEELHKKITNLKKEVEGHKNEIKKLQHEVGKQKKQNEKLEKKFALAQATWAWEKHLGRFVVNPPKKIHQSDWHIEMKKFLEKAPRRNRYTKIQEKLEKPWTDEHWKVVSEVRNERNAMAHPDLIDLDLVECEIDERREEQQPHLKDMVQQLKMAASLMKFGRLTSYMSRLKRHDKKWNKRTMEIIISWDCTFEDIGGLQNVEHEEAKEYLTKFVDNPLHIKKYISIVDSIKHENGMRLGKLAWEIEDKIPMQYGEALSYLKDLLPNPDGKSKSPKDLNVTIAKLHVPDFLPKKFWEHGIEIVEEYFHMHASLTKFGRLAKFYDKNKHLFPTLEASGKALDARVLKNIISWDRDFDEINGLLSIEHGKAKEYMAKYVNDPDTIDRYYFIVDVIKNENKKRLGKLARDIEASRTLSKLSEQHGKALNELKKLLPNPEDESEALNKTTAKLHVPDFLPHYWWKHGLEIVERYFG